MRIKLDRLVVSGFWTFIVLSTVFNDDIFMYIALVLSVVALVFYVYRHRYKLPKKINILFGGLICLYIIGLLWNFTGISIRNIVSLIAITVVFNLLSIVSSSKYNMTYLIYSCLCVLVIFAFFSQTGTLGNTIPGFAVFFSMCAIMQIIEESESSNKSSIKMYNTILVMVFLGLAGYIAYNAGARTALLVEIVIVLVYIILKRQKPPFGLLLVYGQRGALPRHRAGQKDICRYGGAHSRSRPHPSRYDGGQYTRRGYGIRSA